MEDFDALEAQFTGLEHDRAIEEIRRQAEMAAAFHHRLREQNIGKLSATVMTACMLQAFIIGTIMKPDS